MASSSTSSSSLIPYPAVDPQTVQAFARSAQLDLLDFVRSMIEQRQLRDPMGGKARAGDKFMVEVDQFVIGLREPQFEKCGSYDSFGDRVYMKAYRHKLDTPPERRLLKIVWSFEIVWSGSKKIYRVYAYFPLLGNGRAQGQELMKALVQLHPITPRVFGPGGTNILSG